MKRIIVFGALEHPFHAKNSHSTNTNTNEANNHLQPPTLIIMTTRRRVNIILINKLGEIMKVIPISLTRVVIMH